jgi:asparagine synthase (glutamine-hydrolysing)
MLYGAGGEIARGYYHNARTCFTNPSPRYLTTLLHDEMVGYDGMLLTPTAHQEVKGYLGQFVTDTLSTGFAASDVPDVFYLNEIVRRWAGSQFRQVMHNFRVFSPFCTRPYVEAAFKLAPYHRVMESLPLSLIKHINPELFEIPFDKPLMPQTKAALRQKMFKQQLKEDAKTLLRRAKLLETLRKFKNYQTDGDPKLSKGNERIYWLEQVSEHMRTFCLDHASSRLWDYIARDDFELVMKKENAVLRVHNLAAIYNIMTVFYYEQYRKSLVTMPSTLSPKPPVNQQLSMAVN